MNAQSRIKLRTGSTVPIMGLGTWQLTDHTAGTVARAIELGYRLIDTSGDYGTQPGVGEGIRQSGRARQELFIVTKVEEDDDAYEATQQNLDELGLDHADLMLLHRPPADGVGQELWEGLIRARQDGLTTDIGVSNYSIDQIEALIELTGEVPVVNQIEWSPFGFVQEMLDYCRNHAILLQAYSPLTRQTRLDDELLQNLAARYRKTPAQLIIRWNIQLGNVPIIKAGREEHLRENLDVFDFAISDEDMSAIGDLNEQYSSLGSLAYV